MRRKDEKAPDSVADDVLRELKDAIQARTETEKERVNAERDRQQELQALHGDIQAIALGLGEVVSQLETVKQRLVELEEFQRGFSLYVGGELRADMQKLKMTILQVSELLEKALRGWTQAAMLADEYGIDVPKPPGYELGGEGS